MTNSGNRANEIANMCRCSVLNIFTYQIRLGEGIQDRGATWKGTLQGEGGHIYTNCWLLAETTEWHLLRAVDGKRTQTFELDDPIILATLAITGKSNLQTWPIMCKLQRIHTKICFRPVEAESSVEALNHGTYKEQLAIWRMSSAFPD